MNWTNWTHGTTRTTQMTPHSMAGGVFCVSLCMTLLAHADPVVDAQRANGVTVLDAANGVPVVQIATPSAAGVSHNQYQLFNVDSQGVVLNNSATLTPSQLAGYISGNPNLGNGTAPARIILNEVTSTAPSALNGYTEVAGQRAEVIIANPNGISCNGCGFINTSRGVLTTGKPQFDSNGGLAGFDVTGGRIEVGTLGLNASNTDQVDLLARAITVNGELWANQLNVVTGSNRIDHATLNTTALAASDAAPQFSLDVAALGGMYANRIRLIGTEAGVGVRLAGEMMSAGELILTAQGEVTNEGLMTAHDMLRINATTLNNRGNRAAIASWNEIDLSLTNALNNTDSALIYSHGAMTLAAPTVLNESSIIEAEATLRISADDITNQRSRPPEIVTPDAITEGVFFDWDQVAPPPGFERTQLWFTRYTVTPYINLATLAPEAQIISGGNMTLNIGTRLLNDSSVILSGGVLNLNGAPQSIDAAMDTTVGGAQIINQAPQLIQTITENGTYHAGRHEKECRFRVGVCFRRVTVWREYDIPYYSLTTTNLPTLRALIGADVAITGAAVSLDNTFSVTPAAVGSTGTVPGGSAAPAPAQPIVLPDNGLYRLHLEPDHPYLYELDPRFATRDGFLSSDYFFNQLGLDPADELKRLGDGFYEQKLVQEQVLQLTGRRLLNEFANNEAEFKALMDAGVALAEAFQLKPGMTLTAEQIASLTHDLVWLETREVKGQKVLVPVVYLAQVKPGDLDAYGPIMASNRIDLKLSGDLTNTGTITAHEYTDIEADNVLNNGGTLQGGEYLLINANQDVINRSGTISGGDVTINAGRDVVLETGAQQLNRGGNATQPAHGALGSVGAHDSLTTTLVENTAQITGNTITVTAGQDIKLTAAQVAAQQNLVLSAQRDLTLNTLERHERQAVVYGKRSYQHEQVTQVGSTLTAGNDMALQAGHDLQLQSASVNAGNNLELRAGNDVSVESLSSTNYTESHGSDQHHVQYTQTHDLATLQSGGNLNIRAGNDINLTGTVATASGDMALHAQRDTNLSAVVDTTYQYDEVTNAGSFGRSKTTTDETRRETAAGGVLSAGGNLTLNAHRNSRGELIGERSGNVNLLGAALQAQGTVAVAADEDITISGIQLASLDYHRVQTSGTLGLSKRDQGSASETMSMENAFIGAGQQVLLLANNIQLIGADVTAVNGDINLEAVDALLIGAGQVTQSVQNWNDSSGFFTGGKLYRKQEHKDGVRTVGAQASSLHAGGGVNARAGAIKVEGSTVSGDAGVALLADGGDVEITAATTHTESYTYDKEISVGLGDMGKHLARPDQWVKSKNGRLTMKVADAAYSEVDEKTTATGAQSAVVESSNGDVLVQASAGQVTVAGSALHANAGSVGLFGANGVDLTTVTEVTDTTRKTTTASAEVSVVVQHQAVEVVMAAKNVDAAKDKLKQAKQDYKHYQRNLDTLEEQLGVLEADYAARRPGVNYDDILELRELISDTRSDAAYFKAGIVLASVNLTTALTTLAQQVFAAASSAGTWGFNAGVQLDMDASKTQAESHDTFEQGSLLTAHTVVIQTGQRSDDGSYAATGTATHIHGSTVAAQDAVIIRTGELNVTAGEATHDASTETRHEHVTAQMTVYGAAGGASLSGSYDRSRSGERSVTYRNSELAGNSIDISTTDDATFRGATVRADSQLTMDIGGNLTVESVQNRHSSRSVSTGLSAGMSLGGDGQANAGNAFTKNLQGTQDIGGTSGINGGVNASSGRSSSKETVLTSLTSGGEATITVQGHTQLTGAVIATTDATGNDLGHLTFTTGSVDYTDLRNTQYSSNTSAGVSTNISLNGGASTNQSTTPSTSQHGTATEANTAKDANGKPVLRGSTNLTYANSQQNRASKTLATLGHGNLMVGGVALETNGELTEAGLAAQGSGSLLALNRDTTHTNKELWNSDYSQTVDVTVDHRMLTKEGRKEIKEDLKRSTIVVESIADLRKESVSLTGRGEGETDVLKHISNEQQFFTATKLFASDPGNKEYIDVLTSGTATPAQKDAAYTALANTLAREMGIDPVQAMTLVQDHFNLATQTYDGTDIHQIIQGAYAHDVTDPQTGKTRSVVFLVDDNLQTTTDAVQVTGHELSHHLDASKGSAINSDTYRNNREQYADMLGDATVDYLNFNLANSGYGTLGASNQRSDSTVFNPTIAANNASFNRLDQTQVEYRQLYGQEIDWIKQHASEFAKQQGISKNTATQRLTQQALKQVDLVWRATLSDGDDKAAQAFLKTDQTVTNDLNKDQPLFTAEGQQLLRPEQNAEISDPKFYQAYAQPGVSRDLKTGLPTELTDIGVDLKNAAQALGKQIADDPMLALRLVTEALKGLPTAIKEGMQESGHALGEGMAVATDEVLTNKLSELYGMDISTAQKTLQAARVAVAVVSASGAAKAVTQVGKTGVELAEQAGKKLDEVLAKTRKTSASEFIDQTGKTVASVDGVFEPQGLNRNPLDFPDGVKMVHELERTGMSHQDALDAAESFIRSGTTPPVAVPLDVTDRLVKVVPAGGKPSASTGYWMRESELAELKMDTTSLSDKLGLPPGMQVNKFDVYEIRPTQGAITFESKIAPTNVDGVPNTNGGARQTIVVDRNQFTLPVKRETIVVKKKG